MDMTNRPSLNQIAEFLAERAGRQHDFGFQQEMKMAVHLWRQRIMVDSLNSRPTDRQFFQVWIDLPLIEVPISEFPGFPKDACIRRTEQCVPRPIRANGIMYDSITYLNKETRIPLAPSALQVKILSKAKYTGNVARAVEINGYIYTFNYTGPAISVELIPEDMNEVGQINCYNSASDCYNDDKPYPVSGDIGQRIIQAILSTELNRNVSDIKKEELPITNDVR